MRNPFKRSGDPYGSTRKRITPEGEPLEGGGGTSRSLVKIVVPIIIGIIIISIIAVSSVRTVDAGNRGVLVQFGNVDTDTSLDEGLHFVVPFRDNVIQMEVRTQKIVESATSASKDLQDVSTQVALNYHVNPDRAQVLYQQLGPEYASRVITPAIQESVKQVTARFNAEELITKRETVKNQIEEQVRARLAPYSIIVDALSITEFAFSQQFTTAVEAEVEAQAITIIDQQLRNNPTYLEWLKATKWDGKLPLVTGGGAEGGQGVTPFIEIPTAGSTGAAEGKLTTQRTNSTSGVGANRTADNSKVGQ